MNPYCVGQATKKLEAYVYLHDGSIYVGELLSEDMFEISLKTKALKTITINKAFVKKTLTGPNVILTTKGKYHKANPYFFSFDWNAGSSSIGDELTQISFFAGKRIKKRIELGAGLGITNASTSTNDFWRTQGFVNLFAYGKKYLSDNTVRAFIDMKIGWSGNLGENWSGEYSGGLLINPGLGIQIANRKKMKWSFRLSQFIQQTSGIDRLRGFGPDPNAAVIINFKTWLNRTTFGIGINF